MKMLITLLAIITVITLVLMFYCGINLIKKHHMNKAPEITVGMSGVKALRILGSLYDEKTSENGVDTYYWEIKNKKYNGIKSIILKIKDYKVLLIEYK